MSHQQLRDPQGRLIATIRTQSNGDQVIEDPQGRPRGIYDPRMNQTRDMQGRLIGTGNLLTTLL